MTIFARSLFPTLRYFQVAIAVTVTGMPLGAPLPDGSSMTVGGDEMLVFTAGEPPIVTIASGALRSIAACKAELSRIGQLQTG
jgi:hypothetical protein